MATHVTHRQSARRGMAFALSIAAIAAVILCSGGLVLTARHAYATQRLDAAAQTSDVPRAWFDLALTLIERTPGFTPPVASRSLGYLGVTLYEAVTPGMPEYRSLHGLLTDMPAMPQPMPGAAYDWNIVANSALARATLFLFPGARQEERAMIRAEESTIFLHYATAADPDTAARSALYGKEVADAVLVWAATDGGEDGALRNFPSSYEPPRGPGLWVPTPRKGFQKPLPAMQPTWGQNRPFLQATTACTVPPPPAYSDDPQSSFYAEAKEVYDTVEALTPAQRDIALFWSDDPGKTPTPPGHSLSILTQTLAATNASLPVAAEAYARTGIAVADAFIGCWREKYVYNLIRPITYIQQHIDASWNTPTVTDPVETPPFPEYPSGHSVQSGAAATVLTALFGQHDFIDTPHAHTMVPARHFTSFLAFAKEAALSRLYGGIHYRSAIENGLEQGACIGNAVIALPLHTNAR